MKKSTEIAQHSDYISKLRNTFIENTNEWKQLNELRDFLVDLHWATLKKEEEVEKWKQETGPDRPIDLAKTCDCESNHFQVTALVTLMTDEHGDILETAEDYDVQEDSEYQCWDCGEPANKE